MPRRPKKPCAYPGCPCLTENRYCEEHQKQENKRYERYYRQPETKRRYGTKWQRIRKQYTQSHPFCEQCFDNGVYTPVEEVHHIKPLSEGGTHDSENLISLCKYHHSKLHAQRGDRWHRRRKGNVEKDE